MPLTIIRNDITVLSVDAVVNAANTELRAGGGVCGAIFKAAGVQKLAQACKKIGFCPTGEAVITPGFDLKAKYIIHTAGPVYGENPDIEEEQLYSCYKNSLLLAESKRLSSIAFPLISSGIYGYPKAEALKVATRAIKDFLEKSEMQVFLVVYDKASFEISKDLFAAVESFIDERMVEPQRRRFSVGNMMSGLFKKQQENEFEEDSEEDSFSGGIAAEDMLQDGAEYRCILPSANREECAPRPSRSLSDLMERKVETFSQMLLRLIDEKGMTDVEVYKRANIDRKLFSKMRKKDYTPKKSTVMALIIGLRLNMDEAKDLLGRAGFAFSECSKSDIIIEYFIENENYDIFEINETLFAFDEQVLGA